MYSSVNGDDDDDDDDDDDGTYLTGLACRELIISARFRELYTRLLSLFEEDFKVHQVLIF